VQPGAASSSGAGGGDMETDIHEMQSALFSIGVHTNRADVVELFSPGRLQELCAVVGLTPGGAFDLRTGWDFSDDEAQRKCWETLEKMKPSFILGSPKCAPFSQLQNLNNRDAPEFLKKLNEGVKHIDFVMDVYAWQASEGRLFLHEHPWAATSWKLPHVVKVMGIEGVEVRRGDQCCFGLRLKDQHGDKLARKPTGWMSNAPKVLDRVALTCSNDLVGGGIAKHDHSPFVGRDMRVAERYPPKLLVAMLRGVKDQLCLKRDGVESLSALDIVYTSTRASRAWTTSRGKTPRRARSSTSARASLWTKDS
jgi:hypothetical protein